MHEACLVRWRIVIPTEVPFTLKTLSDRTNVPKETLRAWLNERGAFEPVGENAQGHPVFNSKTVERVSLIRELRQRGYGWEVIDGKSLNQLHRMKKEQRD